MITLAILLSHNLSSPPSPGAFCSGARVWVTAQPFSSSRHATQSIRASFSHFERLPSGGAGPEEPNESSDTTVYFFPAHIKTDSFLITTEVNLVKLKPRVQIIAIHMTFKWIHQRQGSGWAGCPDINPPHLSGKTLHKIHKRPWNIGSSLLFKKKLVSSNQVQERRGSGDTFGTF